MEDVDVERRRKEAQEAMSKDPRPRDVSPKDDPLKDKALDDPLASKKTGGLKEWFHRTFNTKTHQAQQKQENVKKDAHATEVAKQKARAMTLETIMRDHPAILRAFLASELADENFDFLQMIKQQVNPQLIYRQFVAYRAPRQVNLPSHVREALRETAESGAWQDLDFTDAYDEIYRLTSRDSLRRMRRSKMFIDYLKKHG